MTDLREDVELELEVALSLLPLISGCVEINEQREAVRHRGNLLDDAQDRRILVREVAQQWRALQPGERRRYPQDRTAAIAEFAIEYVDTVEQSEPDDKDYWSYGYDASMEIVWRKHAEALRLRADAARDGRGQLDRMAESTRGESDR